MGQRGDLKNCVLVLFWTLSNLYLLLVSLTPRQIKNGTSHGKIPGAFLLGITLNLKKRKRFFGQSVYLEVLMSWLRGRVAANVKMCFSWE